jgi:hypothetical protein
MQNCQEHYFVCVDAALRGKHQHNGLHLHELLYIGPIGPVPATESKKSSHYQYVSISSRERERERERERKVLLTITK